MAELIIEADSMFRCSGCGTRMSDQERMDAHVLSDACSGTYYTVED